MSLMPTDQLAVLRDPRTSSYREQLVEYAFLSELLQDGGFRRRQQIDVLRAEVDAAGYDVVLECQGVVRHVQLKSSVVGGRARSQSVHLAFAARRTSAVVWVIVGPGAPGRIALTFRALGGRPGEPIGDLSAYRPPKHAKANAHGVKAERRALRKVPLSAFTAFDGIADLSDWLFGPPLGSGNESATPPAVEP
jgi:hypothetical protein